MEPRWRSALCMASGRGWGGKLRPGTRFLRILETSLGRNRLIRAGSVRSRNDRFRARNMCDAFVSDGIFARRYICPCSRAYIMRTRVKRTKNLFSLHSHTCRFPRSLQPNQRTFHTHAHFENTRMKCQS